MILWYSFRRSGSCFSHPRRGMRLLPYPWVAIMEGGERLMKSLRHIRRSLSLVLCWLNSEYTVYLLTCQLVNFNVLGEHLLSTITGWSRSYLLRHLNLQLGVSLQLSSESYRSNSRPQLEIMLSRCRCRPVPVAMPRDYKLHISWDLTSSHTIISNYRYNQIMEFL